MGDATERPAGVTAAGPHEERPADVTAALPPADVVSEEPYRALSLLALTGFVLAALYAFLVLLGGLVPLLGTYPRAMLILAIVAPLAGAQTALLRGQRNAAAVAAHAGLALVGLAAVLGVGGLLMYSGSSPWLVLQGWGWGLVGAAVFLCWLARTRIAASEGTLSGGALASLGLGLGLFFGLVYGAYWMANSFATSGQARARADEYLETLSNRDDPDAVVKAFFITQPEERRPKSNLRHEAEAVHNTSMDPRGAQPGPFSRFAQQRYVRLLRLPGTTYQFERVERKEFERNGYRVELIYKVNAPSGEFEVSIGTVGVDSAEGAARRRKWHVDVGQCRLKDVVHQTEENKDLETTFNTVHRLVYGLASRVKQRQTVFTFLETLPASSRRAMVGEAALLDPAIMGMTGLPFAGALGASPEGKKMREEYQRFREGALVDASGMWVLREPTKKEMVKEVIGILGGTTDVQCDITPSDSPVPSLRINGDQGEFGYPVRITTFLPGEMRGRYVFEAEVVFTGPLRAAPTVLSPYRLTKVRLLRGQVAPDPMQQGPGGGRPGA